MNTRSNNSREMDEEALIQTEWIVLVGEFLVAAGSIIVLIGLIKAFKIITRE